VWIAPARPNVGKIIDGPSGWHPDDYYALRCKPPVMAILRGILWRRLAVGSALSKITISREYTRVKLASSRSSMPP
jgi:hypothetical protein